MVRALNLLGQAEVNPHVSGKINRLPVALCRLEAYLFCRLNCCLVKTVTQAADHAGHLHLARGEEDHLQNYITLNSESAAFRGINGVWFAQNVDTGGRAPGSKEALPGLLSGDRAAYATRPSTAVAI